MSFKPATDPRTVARDIPGVFDSIFPQLTPGVVAHLNRTAVTTRCPTIAPELVQQSSLNRAMLFELGFAAGEELLAGRSINWDGCLNAAITRQRRYFDAQIPNSLAAIDLQVAEMVANNIATMVSELAATRGQVRQSPSIPGFQWIASGIGDLAAGQTLIEVKCITGNFSAPDYRQIVMYWLLSFVAALENGTPEWAEGILLNPRSAKYVTLPFNDFLSIISSGRTKIEILQLFSSIVGSRNIR